MGRRKFDDAHWHWNGDWPADLWPPAEHPVSHLSMFLAWAIERGLASSEHYAPNCPEVVQLRSRAITPWEYVCKRVVCRLEEEDFNERGRAFVAAYYEPSPCPYFADFCRVFDEEETGYHVADTWANYDRLRPELDAAFESWQERGTVEDM
jgi:hypothetical protein